MLGNLVRDRVFRLFMAGLLMTWVLAPNAEAVTCVQKYLQCLDYADKYLSHCVNGNLHNDVWCALEFTTLQGQCVLGLDLCQARKLLGGGDSYSQLIQWFFF